MLAAVLHGAMDLKLEPVEERPLAADEVRLAFRAGGIASRPTNLRELADTWRPFAALSIKNRFRILHSS